MSRTINIGKRRIGDGQPCFIVAEIGINHNGDMELARRMIDAAAAAGADAVKFQNYRTEDFILDRSLTYEYKSHGRRVKESQYEMFKRCELSTSQLRQLCAHCRKRGVFFFSTPTSEDGIAELVRLGSPLLKNGSDYLVHLPLIRAMAKTGLPTALSTGMATLAEIKEAVRAFRKAGGKKLILLHCTSSYPTPAADVHLRKIPALAAKFGCPTGLSDHTDGIAAAIGAVTMGACFIEKHFTLDKNLPGPDHRFSADPAEFKALVRAVRFAEQALGKAVIGPTPSEMAGRKNFRLSCVAAGDLPANHVLTGKDVAFCRPATGLPPAEIDRLLGRKLRRPVKAGEVLGRKMFE
jgi:N-acetylneuraminate synthase/N,N'-diacetyllegionaminate synthase